MERNVKQLISEHDWLFGLLFDVVSNSLTINEEQANSEQVEEFLEEYIKANTPVPLLSVLINEKAKDSELGEASISLDALEVLFEKVKRGEVINDMAQPIAKRVWVDANRSTPTVEGFYEVQYTEEFKKSLSTRCESKTGIGYFDKGFKTVDDEVLEDDYYRRKVVLWREKNEN